MAILLITRKDAETRLKAAQVTNIECWINGLVAIGLIKIDPDKIVIDVFNEEPVIIKRHGKIVYEE